jgi:protein tyrosine/serine phosphatase
VNFLKLFFLGALLFYVCTADVIRITPQVKNFHYVSYDLYRSGQPNKKGAKELELYGIKTLLNLRLRVDDKQEMKGTSLEQVRIPIKTSKITYQDMVDALKAFDVAEKPVLVHCRRGSDRTGCFVACYRMAFESWSKEDALKELLDAKYGYYDGLFPEIEAIISEIDIDQLKLDVFSK